VAQVGGEARTGRTKATNEGERTLGKGQAPREMCSGVKGRSEPVPRPADRVAGEKQFPFDLNREAFWRVSLAGGPPMYQFSLCDRKGDA